MVFSKAPARTSWPLHRTPLKDHLANHHMIGQVNIKVDGSQAVGEVYFQAFHKVVQDGEEKDLFISGRYVDRYERRDGAWKISFRSEVNDWSRTEADADLYLKGDSGSLIGERKPGRLLLRDIWKPLIRPTAVLTRRQPCPGQCHSAVGCPQAHGPVHFPGRWAAREPQGHLPTSCLGPEPRQHRGVCS